jgi:hypothetical protein
MVSSGKTGCDRRKFSPVNIFSLAWVLERTTPTERLLFVGEVSANFFG